MVSLRCPGAFLALVVGCPLAQASTLRGSQTALAIGAKTSSCVPLVNQGTHSTVAVHVGSPAQKLDVVADTGSDWLLIASCFCQLQGHCAKDSRCFQGTNRSSTFRFNRMQQTMMITFGSGTVATVAATDEVRVGTTQVMMNSSLMLMIESYLTFPIEGILGLGIPGAHKAMQKDANGQQPASSAKDILDRLFRRLGGGAQGPSQVAAQPANQPAMVRQGASEPPETGKTNDGAPIWGTAPIRGRTDGTSQEPLDSPHALPAPKSFMEMAGIRSFSMCFNEARDGVLRFDPPPAKILLGSMGTAHWGLDLRGIAVGNHSAKAVLCGSGAMSKGQKTRCGLIPDSGTTNLMGPRSQVTELLSSICDQWPRCQKNYTALEKATRAAKETASAVYGFDPFHLQIANQSKAAVLKLLLADCARWLDESSLLELPPIRFQVAGAENRTQTLELTGWSYVAESFLNLTDNITRKQTRMRTGCVPSIGEMNYITKDNGPVWIVGTPLFYEYQVGYSLDQSPPSMSFTSVRDAPCSSCGESNVLLATNGRRFPRKVFGEPRVPAFDTSKPL